MALHAPPPRLRRFVALALAFCAPSAWLPLHADDPPTDQTAIGIGVVIGSDGGVSASDREGTIRALRRRSSIQRRDTLIVSSNGRVQFRLADDSVIALVGAARLTLGDFAFDHDDTIPDRVTMAMTSGCLRIIGGSTGSTPGDTFRLDTPFASLSRVGNSPFVLQAAIVDEALYVGVSEGTVEVTNMSGTLQPATDSAVRYARVDEDAMPEPLPDRPAVLDTACVLARIP